MKRVVDFVHAQGGKIGLQLAHAGRKASTSAPWVPDVPGPRGGVASKEEGGWPNDVYAASAIPFSDSYPAPREATLEDIRRLEQAFVDAVERCKVIGYDFIEIHAAHGYLFHTFLSPLANHRTDNYGGSLSNRSRLLLDITEKVRKAWGEDKPLFVRLSGTDWAEGEERESVASGEGWRQWGIEQTKVLSGDLKKLGVDLVDVSSGGAWAEQKIPVGPGYQIPLAAAVKKAHPDVLVSGVGLITDPKQAESYLADGKVDIVFLARELLRHVDWPIYAAQELGVAVKPANQYERAWSRMLTPRLLSYK